MKTRMFYASLLALAVGLASCIEDPRGIIFGSGATLPDCQGGATASTTTPAGGGGEGGSGSTTTDGGASGTMVTTSTTTTESTGGAGGGTTSSSSTMTGPTCQEKACQGFALECGPVWYDCDADGADEVYHCGGCTYPAICGGANVQYQCSDKCFSKYCPICQMQGLPAGSCPVADCPIGYKFDANGDPLITGFGLGDCKNATAPDGTAIKCCVSPL